MNRLTGEELVVLVIPNAGVVILERRAKPATWRERRQVESDHVTRILPQDALQAPHVEIIEEQLPVEIRAESGKTNATIESGVVVRELEKPARSDNVVVRGRVEKRQKVHQARRRRGSRGTTSTGLRVHAEAELECRCRSDAPLVADEIRMRKILVCAEVSVKD